MYNITIFFYFTYMYIPKITQCLKWQCNAVYNFPRSIFLNDTLMYSRRMCHLTIDPFQYHKIENTASFEILTYDIVELIHNHPLFAFLDKIEPAMSQLFNILSII